MTTPDDQPTPCLRCRPDCYECHPDLWMAAVNADFEANAEQYQRDYDEADAVPLSEEEVSRMTARCRDMIADGERLAAERKRIAGSN